MRKVQQRRAIARVLLKYPEGLSSTQILNKLETTKHMRRVTTSRHISILLRGAKGVSKQKNGYMTTSTALTADGHSRKYGIALYTVTDAQALADWVGGV